MITFGWPCFSFPQLEVEQHLALRIVKGQMFTLDVLFQNSLDHLSLLCIMQGKEGTHVASPIGPPLQAWHLNLVFSVLYHCLPQ